MTWLKLDIGIVNNGVWRDGLGLRLWIWLLCKAKVANPQGVVRFSYPVAARQLAYHDGRKVQQPTRQALRRALRRLESGARLVVDEWLQGSDQARTQGGAQGYITVRLTNWGAYQGRASGSDTGSGTGSHPGVSDSCTGRRYTKKRKREKRRENPSGSSTCDTSHAEPKATEGTPERDLLDAIGHCVTKFLRSDPKVTPAWARSMLRAYPQGATAAEVVKADGWCQSNPARSKRRKSATRFLSNWFHRAQESTGPWSPGTTRSPEPDTQERRVRAAEDLGCAPEDLVHDPTTGEYRKAASATEDDQ